MNYKTYMLDTHGIAFERDSGILLVEAPGRLVANQLNNHFSMTARRAIANTPLSIRHVLIAAVDFVPRFQQLWHSDPGDCGF